MPDIAMCKNDACYDRSFCYRYRAKPSSNQSYTEFEPDHTGVCASFWDCREYVEKNLRPMSEIENSFTSGYLNSTLWSKGLD